MVLNFALFVWSCQYSTPRKDGVLREFVFKHCVPKYVFWLFSYSFIVTVFQHWQPKVCDQFVEQIPDEDFGSKA
jgi:hypothetical protein